MKKDILFIIILLFFVSGPAIADKVIIFDALDVAEEAMKRDPGIGSSEELFEEVYRGQKI